MKFKVDENLPIEAATVLRDAGHDALTVHDQNLPGEHDPRSLKDTARSRVIASFSADSEVPPNSKK